MIKKYWFYFNSMESPLMTAQKNKYIIIISLLLAAFAIFFRTSYLNQANNDMTVYNLPWYHTLAEQGIANALATDFTNYNPPYTYLLALATLTRSFLSPLIAIKLIPTFFDLFGAFLIYKITRLKYQKVTSFLAATVYFSAPSIMLNSSYWGQTDSIYTTLLLASLYLILIEKPAAAMAAFGFSLATKAQAVFFIPFLGILFLQKRIHWRYSFIVPLVYLLAILPVVMLGRPLLDTLLIYTNQANTAEKLSANAPNLYYFFSYDAYKRILPLGLLTTITLIPIWIFTSAKNARLYDNKNLFLYAFLSTVLTPFLLPKMHDRYFYPADVFSILLAFYNPELWFIPVIYQFISTASISVFLFNLSTQAVVLAGIVNSGAVAYMLHEQWKLEGWKIIRPATASILSWLIAVLVLFVTLGISARTVFTPLYFRIEYNIQDIFNEPQPHSKYDLIVKSSNIIKYLTSDREIGFLTKLKFLNAETMFTDEEYLRLQNAKKEIREVSFYWLTCILFLYVVALFVWSKNWQTVLQYGIKKGAQIVIGAGVCILPLTLFLESQSQKIIVLQLFSIRTWQGVTVTISLLTTLIGLLIIILINTFAKNEKTKQ